MNTETVYILDDDSDQGELIALTLNSHGLSTSIYTRPEHFLSEISPDFVGCLLLDLRMPLLSGLEVQQTLIDRQIPLPVIFLTSFGDLDAAVTSLKKGALDFIQKPVAPQHLVESVKRAILVSQESARLHTQ